MAKTLADIFGQAPTQATSQTGGAKPLGEIFPKTQSKTVAPTVVPKKDTSPEGFWASHPWLKIGLQTAAGSLSPLAGPAIGAAKEVIKAPIEAAKFGAEIGKYAAEKVGRPLRESLGIPSVIDKTGMEKFEAEISPPSGLKAKGVGEQIGAVGADIGLMLAGGEPAVAGKLATAAAKIPKLGKTLAWLSEVSAEAAQSGVLTGALTGDTEAAKVGAVIPPAFRALGGLGKIGGLAAKFISSKLGNVPTEAIDEAIQNPSAVSSAIREAAKKGDEYVYAIHDKMTQALADLRNLRTQNYEQGMATLEKETMQTKAGQWYVKKPDVEVGAKEPIWVPTDLSVKGVKDVITKTLKDFGVEVKKEGLDYLKSRLEPYAANVSEVKDLVKRWDDFSPTGLNTLRQKLSDFKVSDMKTVAGKQFNAFLDSTVTNLRNYVGERVPQIAEMNKQYAKESEVLDRITTELSLGPNVRPSMAMRKMLNVFNPKSVVYRDVMKELSAASKTDLMADIAGSLMASNLPEGLGAYLTSAVVGGGAVSAVAAPALIKGLIPLLLMGSPRLIGETATAVGKAAPAIKKAAPVMRKAAALIGGKLSKQPDQQTAPEGTQ